MCKSCMAPPPSECIAALNSPQCLAVSQFQCDVFTSRSNETGRGAFSAAHWWDRRRLAHREDRHKLSDRGPKRKSAVFCARSLLFCVCFLSLRQLNVTLSQFVRKWFTGQLWRRDTFCGILAFTWVFTLNFTSERKRWLEACLQHKR